jgi:hypothetical protein
MKIALLGLVLIAFAGSVEARSHHRSYAHHSFSHYRSHRSADAYNTDVSGHRVHRPNQALFGGTARCRDGEVSHSRHHSGVCSHHGGIAR